MFDPKKIVLFGAGKSATVLIDYLKQKIAEKNWWLIVADGDPTLAASKLGNHPNTKAVGLDIRDSVGRFTLIQQADVVISLLPPALHYLVAQDCLQARKHLLTASYIDDALKQMASDIHAAGLLFLCEMGLDPGIDHMSAMELIHRIVAKGGRIERFRSHCGGLVAPESDTNPWHYKISWNPRNVVMAGTAGARYLEAGNLVVKPYEQLFWNNETVFIEGIGELSFYPNRDSIPYRATYGLHDTQSFVRTTLRYPAFCTGWQHIVSLKLTDDHFQYATDGVGMQDFLQQHCQQHQLSPTLIAGNNAALKEQMAFLGLTGYAPINLGVCSAATVLQSLLEQKLVLEAGDKDMVVMLHELHYVLDGKTRSVRSSLVVKGKDQLHTAMATTVGLPLGIAAVLLLEGRLNVRGLQVPIIPAIYQPVLSALAAEGVVFKEQDTE